MSTKLDNLDSTAASSFTMDINGALTSGDTDTGAQIPSDSPKSPDLSSLDEGASDFISSDWFDESDAGVKFKESTPREDELQSTEEQEQGEEPSSESAQSEEAKASSASEISIEAFKKEHTFKLDPEDANLRRTLRRGLKAPKFKEELDKSRQELADLKSTIETQREAVSVWDEIKEHIEAGNYEKVFRAVAGDKFDEYLQNKLNRRIEYMEADPLRRAEMEREDASEAFRQSQAMKDKRIKELEARDASREEEAQLSRYESYAIPALEQNKFTADEVKDSDVRHRLNKRIWRNAWDELDDLRVAGQPITQRTINSVFAQEAKLLKGEITRRASTEATETVKKEESAAKELAAQVATSRYPKQPSKTEQEIASKWDGRSAKDLFKLFR